MNLVVGSKFRSKWFKGTVEVIAIKEGENILEVKIYRDDSDYHHFEDWNLQHTRWGFEQGDYFPLKENG